MHRDVIDMRAMKIFSRLILVFPRARMFVFLPRFSMGRPARHADGTKGLILAYDSQQESTAFIAS
jgi:hypothetical protein